MYNPSIEKPGHADNSLKAAKDLWPAPVSLERPVLAPFPVESLPEPLRAWVAATAEATQTPVDLPALLALAICGSCAARRVEIEAGRGWKEPIVLFVACLLEPGNRKSAVVSAVLKPVLMIERELIEKARPVIAAAKRERAILDSRLKVVMKKAATGDAAAADNVHRISEDLSSISIPYPPELRLDDGSPESIEIAMEQQGGRVMCAGSEGGLFDIMAGRYSGSANIDIFLKGHAGEDLRVSRVSRGGIMVPNCCLTLAYAVQPDVIRGLASNQSMRGRGLLARFLYALPLSPLGSRKIDPEPVSTTIEVAYHKVIRRLHEIQDDRGQPWTLRLSKDAETRFLAWRAEIEAMFREDGRLELMKDWGGKLPGAAARIAGIIHLIATKNNTPWSDPVSLQSINAGIEIAMWAIAHAEAVLGLMVADDGSLDDALYILRWLGKNGESEVSRRQIQNHGRRRFDGEPSRLERALSLLVDRGWLRQIDTPRATGRPTERYQVFPGLIGHANGVKDQSLDGGDGVFAAEVNPQDREAGVI